MSRIYDGRSSIWHDGTPLAHCWMTRFDHKRRSMSRRAISSAITAKLQSDSNLQQHTTLSNPQIPALIDLCLKTSYFVNDGNYHQQIHCAVMDLPRQMSRDYRGRKTDHNVVIVSETCSKVYTIYEKLNHCHILTMADLACDMLLAHCWRTRIDRKRRSTHHRGISPVGPQSWSCPLPGAPHAP